MLTLNRRSDWWRISPHERKKDINVEKIRMYISRLFCREKTVTG